MTILAYFFQSSVVLPGRLGGSFWRARLGQCTAPPDATLRQSPALSYDL